MSDQASGAKAQARAAIDATAQSLVELSHKIHAHPELAFEEELASSWCAEALSASGFDIDMGICGLPTAFAGRAGSGPLTVAICAEYDALPDIGHACGHNVIAASAVGAAVGLAPLADDLGITVASSVRRPKRAAVARSSCSSGADSTGSMPPSWCTRRRASSTACLAWP